MNLLISMLFGILAGTTLMSGSEHKIVIALVFVIVGIIISNGSAFGEVSEWSLN